MNEVKNNLREELLSMPYANEDTIRHQIMIRCPFCGDSVKHHDSTHFGVLINPYDNSPIFFHCFRCDIGGVLDQRTLRMLGSFDLELNNAVYTYNTKAVKSSGKSKLLKTSMVKLKIPEVIINERTLRKHEYIEKRLGLKLDIQELANKKVIYNFGNLLNDNKIYNLTCKPEYAQKLQNEYVGFLSARNEFINFRNIGKDGMRWYIYNILGRLDNTRKFYIMPNQIDLFTKDIITINICEGAFDALGIYYHIFDKESDDMLYVAACGAGFLSVIKYILAMGAVCNVDINIFSDADRPTYFYKNIVRDIADWVNSINVYYNEKEKDYGVRRDQIQLIKKRI